MTETKDRKLCFRERNGTSSVTVYVTAYDKTKKRGVQTVLGSFPRGQVIHSGAAGIPDDSRLAQNLAPTEMRQIDEWAQEKRAEREASTLAFTAQYSITNTLEKFIKALEAGAYDENQIQTQRIHELLDDARKAMNKHGLKRQQKRRQTAQTLPGQSDIMDHISGTDSVPQRQ